MIVYALFKDMPNAGGVLSEHLTTFSTFAEYTLTIEVLLVLAFIELISAFRNVFIMGTIPALLTVGLKVCALVIALNVSFSILPNQYIKDSRNSISIPWIEYSFTPLLNKDVERLIGIKI